MKDFFKKVFDKHHKMERFGVSTLVILILMSILTTTIGMKSYRDNHQALTDKAIYTTEFTMSRSQAKGHVVDIFTNEAKTSALVLLKFDDVSQISVDANNYVVFLRGYDLNKNEKVKMESNPSGAIYMFGTTGYMGIHLVDKQGLANQITYMTIRNDKELTNVDSENIELEEGVDSQYATYDLTDIFFNMGANNTTVVKCLDNDVLTVRDMYEECVARYREKEIKDKLETDLNKMRSDLVQIAEYEQRLNNLDIAINKPYDVIDGDYIVNADGKAVASMDYTATLEKYTEGEHLQLVSTNVCVGGVDFDWYNGNVYDGYINNLKGSMTAQEYVNQFSTDPNTSDDIMLDSKWYYKSSGKEFILSQGGFSQTSTDIQTSITGLQGAWQAYYGDKRNYECVDLISLLELDYEVMNVDNNYTVNNNKNAFVITR